MSDMIQNILLSGAGITFFLLIIGKIIPNKKLEKIGYKIGKSITKFGSEKIGRRAWNQIENFLVNSSSVLLKGIKKGLFSDNEVKK